MNNIDLIQIRSLKSKTLLLKNVRTLSLQWYQVRYINDRKNWWRSCEIQPLRICVVNCRLTAPQPPIARLSGRGRTNTLVIDSSAIAGHPFHKYFPIKLLCALKNATSSVLRNLNRGRLTVLLNGGRRTARAHARAPDRDRCWMEWGSAQNHGANCENYKEWIYLLILLVPLLWTTGLVCK